MSGADRTSILLSAFACDPLHGSERQVGWCWMKLLSRQFHRVFVLTREFNRASHPAEAVPANVEFVYFDLPFGGARIPHKSRFIKPYYILWQLFALLHVARQARLKRVPFIQHVTYNVADMPGFLWLLRGRTFVLGPIGGGQVPPRSLKRVFGPRGWRKERLRRFLKALLPWNPVARAAVRRADLVLFANEDTARRLARFARRSELMLETAIDANRVVRARAPEPEGEPFRILWLNHVERRKALILALDAFRAAVSRSARPLTLDVVGDGPALTEAKAHAIRTGGLAQHVRFHGRIPFAEVPGRMRAAGAFLFTSVQDTSGNVVLEAMAAGAPVVALDHQGARQMLSGGGGLLVKIGSYDDTVSRLAEALLALAGDASLRAQKSAEALERVKTELSWDAKSRRVTELYGELR